jgi:hypothetical protein
MTTQEQEQNLVTAQAYILKLCKNISSYGATVTVKTDSFRTCYQVELILKYDKYTINSQFEVTTEEASSPLELNLVIISHLKHYLSAVKTAEYYAEEELASKLVERTKT